MAKKANLRRCLETILVSAGFVLSVQAGAEAAITLSARDTLVRDISSGGLILSFQVSVANDSASERWLVRTRYRVTVNRGEFLNMDAVLDEPVLVPPRGEVLVALPVKITYALLFAAVGPVEGRPVCEAAGEMIFENERRREERIPFAFSADFPIFKDPELDFLPLRINGVSIGGADVVFRPRFRNVLGYELLVDRIRFRLYLAGMEVLEGEIPGDKSLPGGVERIFDLAVLVDFFDLGQEVRSGFDTGTVPLRFTGELEIASAWGKILVPFDKSDDVSVEKHS